MEILSPAGDPTALVAAVKGGCDAVYPGDKTFGARAYTGNFSDPQLEGAIAYCHDNGVKVYVTVNTLIKDTEMAEAVSFVRFLRDVHADAVLIQDLGLISKKQPRREANPSGELLFYCSEPADSTKEFVSWFTGSESASSDAGKDSWGS